LFVERNSISFLEHIGRTSMRLATCVALAAMAALSTGVGGAATITLAPTQDTWVSTASGEDVPKDQDVEGLILSEPAVRRVFLQWDLSSIPATATIDAAHIELYLGNNVGNAFALNGRTNSDAGGTVTFDETTLSNSLANAAPYSTNQVESTLGDFTSFNGPVGQYFSSANASAGDLALLQTITDADGSLIVQIYGTTISGSNHRYFEDREGTLGTNNAPRLVVDYTIPEPSSWILITVTATLFGGMRLCFSSPRRIR
jgi:fructose-specific component phosphotransferase system IIB-like protein